MHTTLIITLFIFFSAALADSCFSANQTYISVGPLGPLQLYTCTAPINWFNSFTAYYSVFTYSENSDNYMIYFGYCGNNCNLQTSAVYTWSTTSKYGYADGKMKATVPGAIWQPFIEIRCLNYVYDCKIRVNYATIDVSNKTAIAN
jgi:hypothetical protein